MNENLLPALRIMLYGMGTTFFILITFYFMVRILNKLFSEKE